MRQPVYEFTSPRLWRLEPRGRIVQDAPRILVAEDEYLIALELETQLTTAGYRVIGPASDVDGALELLNASRPDGAILDVNLAGEWVTPVARELKAMSVPYILASGRLRSPSYPARRRQRREVVEARISPQVSSRRTKRRVSGIAGSIRKRTGLLTFGKWHIVLASQLSCDSGGHR